MCSWLKAGLKVWGQESHFYRRLTRHEMWGEGPLLSPGFQPEKEGRG